MPVPPIAHARSCNPWASGRPRRFARSAIVAFAIAPFCCAAHADRTLDNLFLHIVAHEVGHAFIREFDLPITASEEAMADAFAVVALHAVQPERVADIVADRVAAHLEDDDDVDAFSEYPPAAQRAGSALCLTLALDPEQYAGLADRFGLQGERATRCLDYSAEIVRGWRRTIAPYRMPEGARVTETAFQMADDVRIDGRPDDGAISDAMTMLAGIDWHSLITLVLERCDGGANWSRNGRTITVCDDYLVRIAAQAKAWR